MSGMKRATIKSVLNSLIMKWLATIRDVPTREAAARDCFVTGGAISSMLVGEMPNDFDIYFKTRETALAVAKYYVDTFNLYTNETHGKKVKEVTEYNTRILQSSKWHETQKNQDWYKQAYPQGFIWPPEYPMQAPQRQMYTPMVKEEMRMNCLGNAENRIIIYMKSAGIASEKQSQYKYFEQEPDEETDKFFQSLNGGSQADMEYNHAAENPLEYVEDMAKGIKRPPGRPTDAEIHMGRKYRPVFLSENAITLSDKLQLIVRFYGKPSDIHVNYDYVHCMCWYDYAEKHLELPAESMESILSKALIYKGSLYPLASLFRLRKFIGRGWRITAGQMLKIMFQVSKINLEDMPTLREQLLGVDQAYMHQLMRAIENADQRIDSTYLAKLIDEIFE